MRRGTAPQQRLFKHGPPSPLPLGTSCSNTAGAAYGTVDVPESVIDLLTGVRNYLQVCWGSGDKRANGVW